MKVRLATQADLPRLLPMMADFNALEGIPWNPSRTEAALGGLKSDATLGCALIAESEGEVCGYAVLAYGFDLEFGGRDAFINELFLIESMRGQGLGGQLMGIVEEAARKNGGEALHLMVDPENRPALRLYERLGFTATHRVGLSKVMEAPGASKTPDP